MADVTNLAMPVVDIWPYVGSVPELERQGHDIWGQFVDRVYRNATASFDHVLVMTKTKNVYLAVVVDLVDGHIHGHHLLDLNRKYEIKTAHLSLKELVLAKEPVVQLPLPPRGNARRRPPEA